jgi:1-acyl-sn-glycerol-3-phosphate acyltransferase
MSTLLLQVVATKLRRFPKRFPVHGYEQKSRRYRCVSFLSRLFFRFVFGGQLRIEGAQRLEQSGRVVVVSNHLSNLDPFIFGGFSKPAMFCMAKRELYRFRFVAWLLAGCNCFPVDRGAADRRAMRVSLDILEHGGRLLIFLEGTRARRPGMKRTEAGVGFLVRRAQASVLPVAVWGTERAHRRLVPRRVPVCVRYGEPVPCDALVDPQRRDDQRVADAIAERIAALLPPEYRGVYAPVPGS